MQKRKRGDRAFSADNGQRPPPHSPDTTDLGRQSRDFEQRVRGQGNHYRGNGGRGRGRGSHSSARRGGYQEKNDRDRQTSAPTTPTRHKPSQSPFPPVIQSSQAPARPSQPSSRTSNIQPLAPSVTLYPTTSGSMVDVDTIPIPAALGPPGYYWEVMTDDLLSEWEDKGMELLVQSAQSILDANDVTSLFVLYEEILMAGILKRIHPHTSGEALKRIWHLDDEAIRIKSGDTGNATADHEQHTDDRAALRCLDAVSIFAIPCVSHPLLPIILRSMGIAPALMRTHLGSDLLVALGMVRPKVFDTKAIRNQTNELYRQEKFNLMREETEGYAKLITELSNLSSITNPTISQAAQSFQRIKALIGAFSLEPGRVLDIVTDVISATLVRRYRFFVKFLRVSTWWPSATSLDADTFAPLRALPCWALEALESASMEDQHTYKENREHLRYERDTQFWERARQIGIDAFFELRSSSARQARNVDLEWIRITGTPPPSGNRVAAQLIGFKFRYYSNNKTGQRDKLLGNLISLAALLIKIGFISLVDLYPHLYPFDKDMEDLKEKKMAERADQEKNKRPGIGADNALTKAGALTDDTLPPSQRQNPAFPKSTTSDVSAEASREKSLGESLESEDQKVLLLRSLLSIGALPESLFILGKFPWLRDAFPEIMEHLHRILHHSLGPIMKHSRPLKERGDLHQPSSNPATDSGGAPRGVIKCLEERPRLVHRWANLDKGDDGKGNRLVFYWDDWADQIPICHTYDDVLTLCSTLLNISGVNIGRDVKLLTSLTRIGCASLDLDSSAMNLQRWVGLSKRLIVPALSLTEPNIGTVMEVYKLVERFDQQTRFSIYSEWFSGATSRQPDIKAAIEITKAQTRDILKRISKTNTRQMAQALAKVTYSSPGAVFAVALSQIESYDNLTEVVIECAEYFAPMGYDVLTWSLLSSLGGPTRDRVQANGLLTSRWLCALSQFTGQVSKRYSLMKPGPLLHYVSNQLQKKQTSDLIVLKEIITSMGGLISDVNFSEAQTAAMAGGPILRHQVLLSLHDARHTSRQSSRRLVDDLIHSGLVDRLLLSLANRQQTIIYIVPDEQADLKILGNIQDALHETLGQYMELLRTNLTPDQFEKLIPGVIELIAKYRIDPKVAFWISRDTLARAILPRPQALNPSQSFTASASRGDFPDSDSFESTDHHDDSAPAIDRTVTTQLSVVSADPDVMADLQKTSQAEGESLNIDYMQNVIIELQAWLPQPILASVSTSFYFTFWQLSLHDILVPSKSYEEENKRLTGESIAVSKDRSDMSTRGLKKREEKQAQISTQKDMVNSEFSLHIEHKRLVSQRLRMEKDKWFADFVGVKPGVISDAILQHCLLPRAMMSSIDASFSFRFIKAVHQQNASYFRTLDVYNRLFKERRLAALIFLSTTAEATNLGFFLNEILRDLQHWHSSRVLYEKEAFGPKRDYVGFAKTVRGPAQPESLLDHAEFSSLLSKWHGSLLIAIRRCFDSREYMHISNAITVLRAIYQHFPRLTTHGQALLSSLSALKTDEREDLKLSANALFGLIKRKEKEWRNTVGSKTTGETGSPRPSPRPVSRTPRSGTPQVSGGSEPPSSALAPEVTSKAPEIPSRTDPRKPSENSNEALEAARKKLIQDREAKEAAAKIPERMASGIEAMQVDASQYGARKVGTTAPISQMSASAPPTGQTVSGFRYASTTLEEAGNGTHPQDRSYQTGRRVPEPGRLDRPSDMPPIQRYASESRFEQTRNGIHEHTSQADRRSAARSARDIAQPAEPRPLPAQMPEESYTHPHPQQSSQAIHRVSSNQMFASRRLDPGPIVESRGSGVHRMQQNRVASLQSGTDHSGHRGNLQQPTDDRPRHAVSTQPQMDDGWGVQSNFSQLRPDLAASDQSVYQDGKPPTEPRSTRPASARIGSVNGQSISAAPAPPYQSPSVNRVAGPVAERRSGDRSIYNRSTGNRQESTYGRLNQDQGYHNETVTERNSFSVERSDLRPNQTQYSAPSRHMSRDMKVQPLNGASDRHGAPMRTAPPSTEVLHPPTPQYSNHHSSLRREQPPVSPADLADVHPSRLNAVVNAAGVPPIGPPSGSFVQNPNKHYRDSVNPDRFTESQDSRTPRYPHGTVNERDTVLKVGRRDSDQYPPDHQTAEKRFSALDHVLNRDPRRTHPTYPSPSTHRDTVIRSPQVILTTDSGMTNGDARGDTRKRLEGPARTRSRSPASSRGDHSYRASPKEREPLRGKTKAQDHDRLREFDPESSSMRSARRGDRDGERERESDRNRDLDRVRTTDDSGYRSSRGSNGVEADRNIRRDRVHESDKIRDDLVPVVRHRLDSRPHQDERERERVRSVGRGNPGSGADLFAGDGQYTSGMAEGSGANGGWKQPEGQFRRSLREKREFESDGRNGMEGGDSGREARRAGR